MGSKGKGKSSFTLDAWVTRGPDIRYSRNGVTLIKNDTPLLTLSKPIKSELKNDRWPTAYWYVRNFDTIELPAEAFPEVKWEDEEPTRVKITIEIL